MFRITQRYLYKYVFFEELTLTLLIVIMMHYAIAVLYNYGGKN